MSRRDAPRIGRRELLAWGGAVVGGVACKTERRAPIVLSIPHAGERIPPVATWLEGKPEKVLATDLDRYLDRLYVASAKQLRLDTVVCEFSRYAIDVNRNPESIDASSVEGAPAPPGKNPRGAHPLTTTQGDRLIVEAMPRRVHDDLVASIYRPYHEAISGHLARLERASGWSLLLDLHSFPSTGQPWDLDPGKRRTMDVVVSDVDGKSADRALVDIVQAAFRGAGFTVSHNFPYVGSHTIRRHARPAEKRHAIQIELNRFHLHGRDEQGADRAPVERRARQSPRGRSSGPSGPPASFAPDAPAGGGTRPGTSCRMQDACTSAGPGSLRGAR